jgi:phage portal protein BeeE
MGVLEAVAERRRASLARYGRKHNLAFGGGQGFSQSPFWAYDALTAPLLATTPLYGNLEKIDTNFEGYVTSAYKANGVVFACLLVRQLIFSEARFQWREYRQGRPGELFGSEELTLLEQPWPGGTTGELLARMELHASLAGNFYATLADDGGRLGRAARGPTRRIVVMRPDWVTIVIGQPSDPDNGDPNALDARILAYIYEPPPIGGGRRRSDPQVLLPEEVCHFSPLPDPLARYRGMSWLTPLVEDIRADKAATVHKSRFFTNGATPNLAIVFDKDTDDEAFEQFVAKFRQAHQGADKAYKTLFLAGGADVKPLSVNLRDLEFKTTQGGGEERIMAAAGLHPAMVGLAGGLEGSSLNAGNLGTAARLTGNKTMKPLWRIAAASLQTLVTPPRPSASLWYDDRDIAFLREDAADLAKIRSLDAQALRTLADGGWEADAAVEFVQTNDLNRLRGRHSGLLPVQQRPPGSGEDGVGSANGNGRIREAITAR